jgi:hypothetical protein
MSYGHTWPSLFLPKHCHGLCLFLRYLYTFTMIPFFLSAVSEAVAEVTGPPSSKMPAGAEASGSEGMIDSPGRTVRRKKIKGRSRHGPGRLERHKRQALIRQSQGGPHPSIGQPSPEELPDDSGSPPASPCTDPLGLTNKGLPLMAL